MMAHELQYQTLVWCFLFISWFFRDAVGNENCDMDYGVIVSIFWSVADTHCVITWLERWLTGGIGHIGGLLGGKG